jgi:hypothetical protein
MGIDGPRHGFSCWAFDFKNDGWLDIFHLLLEDIVKGLQGSPHRRYNNEGKYFVDIIRDAGLDSVHASMGSNFGNFDNVEISAPSTPFQKNIHIMAWIKTISFEEGDEHLQKAMADQRPLYPKEYANPVPGVDDHSPGIVASHSLIPDALYHAFATFGSLMSPDLPLERRQHEMIATMVSVTNRCHY